MRYHHQYPNPLAQQRRPPGGIFPEGWEFFRPVQYAIWLVEPVEGGSEQTRRFSILGICPCKTPLDKCFDSRRRGLRDVQTTVQPVKPRSEAERTALEKERRTSDRFCASWHPEDIAWCIGDFWERNSNKAANVKVVVNLCATERYYNQNDFFENGIEYIWHKIEGGGRLPQPRDLIALKDLWDTLRSRYSIEIDCGSKEELQEILMKSFIQLPIILVHCTHGVNRTGFVVSAIQMMTDKNITAEEAAVNFGKCRGHYINRPELVGALVDLFSQEQQGLLPPRSAGHVVLGLSSTE
eukprot:Blabericola_migrator_1__7485@NODE_3820_length_1488_cov_122_015482_g2370_i0_p1_GENE_NODE_3820_length_1488_cov_122_015482_g2370_i0NODE_3820_length_1488_cov_122_015482_g2370_i0_p1_ORF_typecomplete_len296_score45_69DSPc/PF00782_20/9_2e10Y_phosphatase2/PF03162_13/7_8e06Y_phosphatase3/PF13350_6/7_6e05Y_phosphatase/PF00102_27/0_011PTPlike_phytase/PF14566_6/0_091CDKN3/PF05706_12/1_3e03CDKN3/PF05706_12/0_37Myotubrelated/PF06602_14/0_17_NODE_3820_length_1488_cov_122_015482_g2370_i082969